MLAHRDEGGPSFRPRAVACRLRTAPKQSCRTVKFAWTVARVGRWLLPWASVLILSGSMAYALDAGLARMSHEPPHIVASSTLTLGAGCDPRGGGAREGDQDQWTPARLQNDCTLASAEPGARWLTLGAIESDGSVTSLSCLARTDRVVADPLYVPAEDMDAAVSEVCLKTGL